MSPTMWLIVILAAATPATYGYMWTKQQYLVHQAYKRGKVVGAEEVATGVNKEALETVRRALEGERQAPIIPTVKKELVDLCNKSASCRDRGRQ